MNVLQTARGRLTLHITRDRLSGTAPDGTSFELEATLGLVPSKKGKAAIFDVGVSEAEMRRHIEESERRHHLPPLRVVVPGQDAWWDAQWRWPRPTRAEERALRAPAADSETLLIRPLRRESWSPPFANALFRYTFFRHGGTGVAAMAAGLGPIVDARLDSELDDLERAELADALATAWPQSHLVVRPPAPPYPTTPAAATRQRVTRAWLACLCLLTPLLIASQRLRPFSAHRDLVFWGILVVALPPGFWISRLGERIGREAPRRMAALGAVSGQGSFPPIPSLWERTARGIFVLGAVGSLSAAKHLDRPGYHVHDTLVRVGGMMALWILIAVIQQQLEMRRKKHG